METRRPIIIYATDGPDRYPIELTRQCSICLGKGETSDGDIITDCRRCRGKGTEPTANGLAVRRFLSEQLS